MVTIQLTEEQMKVLQPLFDKIDETNKNPKTFAKSCIILQPDDDGYVEGDFIPPKYAMKIRSIIVKYLQELEEE